MTDDTNIRRKVLAKVPLAIKLGFDDYRLASSVGVSMEALKLLENDPSFVAEMNDAIANAELDGSLNTQVARMLTGKALDRIAIGVDSMDPFEAAEVLKPLQRILDAADKRDALIKDKYDDLRMINIVIGSNMSMSTPPAGEIASLVEELQDSDVNENTQPTAIGHTSPRDMDPFEILTSAIPVVDENGGNNGTD